MEKQPILGKLEQGDLRKIWPLEPLFSKWLAEEENLNALGDTIGIGMISPECESEIGDFSADIVAQEDGGERKIIIENQLETTNHDHLGKIITYASGADAKIVIWIVRKARAEHRAAIKWLNDISTDDIGFFLIEITVWRIGNSQFAPMFKVVENPNEWVKQARSQTKLTATKEAQLRFWVAFMEFAMNRADFSRMFNSRMPNPQHWLDLAAGSADYHISLIIDSRKTNLSVAIYIPDSKTLFDHFLKSKLSIEKELGVELDWQRLENKKAARIRISRTGDFQKDSERTDYFEWLCDYSIRMKRVFAKYAKE